MQRICVYMCSLASQTHFCKKRKGLVNCVYKLCPTGMQLSGWHNQISNNITYFLWSAHPLRGVWSKCFYSSYSSRKDVLAVCHHFQDHCCYSNGDVICHETRYCNVIGPHWAGWCDKACIHRSPDPSFFVEEGLACKTNVCVIIFYVPYWHNICIFIKEWVH